MYPDSLKISDEVDREIAKDINKSSYKIPLTWDPLENYSYLREQLAFPGYFEQGWIGSIVRVIRPASITSPLKSLYSWSHEMLST